MKKKVDKCEGATTALTCSNVEQGSATNEQILHRPVSCFWNHLQSVSTAPPGRLEPDPLRRGKGICRAGKASRIDRRQQLGSRLNQYLLRTVGLDRPPHEFDFGPDS